MYFPETFPALSGETPVLFLPSSGLRKVRAHHVCGVKHHARTIMISISMPTSTSRKASGPTQTSTLLVSPEHYLNIRIPKLINTELTDNQVEIDLTLLSLFVDCPIFTLLGST